jgi:S1-C subfamily serine protease
MVREITAQLIIYGKMRRGVLGVVTQGLTPQSADAFGIRRRHGVVIAPVEADSPAVRGTFKSGDVVMSQMRSRCAMSSSINSRCLFAHGRVA